VEPVVATAEAPADAGGGAIVRTTAAETPTTTRAAAPKPPQWGQMSKSARKRWHRAKGPSV
jgi:hypothetical protein